MFLNPEAINGGKVMKKWYLGFLAVVVLMACSLGVYADHGPYKQGRDYDKRPTYSNKKHNNKLQSDARFVIHRTAIVITDAQKQARYHRYSFGLSRAVSNQKLALEFYSRGSYQDAIFHSLRARDLAFQVISGNGQRRNREYERDQMEEGYAHRAPRGADLDRSANRLIISSDNGVIRLFLNLDLD